MGGDTLAERNVISGNVGWGVLLQSGGVNNQILGNKIGLNGDGSAALPNGDGGIWVVDTPGTRIGSGAASEGNSIGGNSGSGIVVEGASSAGAVIEGNGIGADQPNTADGIHLGNAAVDVSIGGNGSAGNIIHSNAGAGIAVFGPGAPANGIEILGNSIYLNGGLGIDLGSDGVTANDAGDSDSGPNDLLNFPILTSAASMVGGGVDIQGTVDTMPARGTIAIDIYPQYRLQRRCAERLRRGRDVPRVADARPAVNTGVRIRQHRGAAALRRDVHHDDRHLQREDVRVLAVHRRDRGWWRRLRLRGHEHQRLRRGLAAPGDASTRTPRPARRRSPSTSGRRRSAPRTSRS